MRIIFKWWNFKCTLQKFRKTIHLRLDSLEKKKKKIRLFHSTTRFLYQHLIIVPLQCIAIPGLGFRRGSYRCICKRGFYYPDIKSTSRYYNGTVIEEEFEKLMMVSFLLIFFFSLWNTFAKIPSVYFLLVKLQLLKILFAKKIRFNDDLSTVLDFRNSIERSSSTQFYLEICNEEKKKENV